MFRHDAFILKSNQNLILLNFDGADGSTTFTDSSPFNRSFTTRFGSPVISTAQSKEGGSSLYLDGSSSIFTPDAADLELGDSNFDFSFSIYPTASLANKWLFSRWESGNLAYQIYTNGTGKIAFDFRNSVGGVSTATGATAIPLNTWTDVSIAREGGFIKLRLNDVQDSMAGVSGSMLDGTSRLVIGTWPTGGSGVTGYIDKFKLDKS